MKLEEQVAYLLQGTDYGDESLRQSVESELRQRLQLAQSEKRPLRVYCGFDPRTSDLHIGHMVPIRKLSQFQELGHEVVFLVGRYTSLIGDPSDKDKLRPQITLEQATENARTYAEQAFKSGLLNEERTRIEFNDTWLAQLEFKELVEMASNFTIQQFLTRETFRKRFDENDPLYLHELFYALMQAYDAYHLRADVQVGGTDQLFNIVTASRKLMESKGQLPNIPIIVAILPGTDGEIKMSKSLGNHIPIAGGPNDMFGKLMSVPDAAMGVYFRLTTRWGPEKIAETESALASGDLHPRQAKADLALEVTSIYHGQQAAQSARAQFDQVFKRGGVPDDVPVYAVPAGANIVDVMVDSGMAPSKSQARRLLAQDAVRVDGNTLTDPEAEVREGDVLQVGKRRFRRLKFD